MKISSLVIMLVLHFHLIYPQDTATKSTYTFGNHGIEISLDDSWNFVQKTEDWYEVLYGCAGTEKCANIQVNFWHAGIGGTIEENIENLIKEYKSRYNNFEYVKSIKTINDLQFLIVDLYALNNGLFFGQTVAVANTKSDVVDLTYTTNKLIFHTKQGIEKYNEERNEFLDVLSTIKSIGNEIEPKRSSDMTLLSCGEVNNFLITHMDSLYCFIQLSGQASIRPDGEMVTINSNILRSFLAYKKPFLKEESSDNSDEAILLRFVDLMSYAMYKEYGYQNSNLNRYYYFLPLDSSFQENGIIWYPFFNTEREVKKIIKTYPEDAHLQFEKSAEIFFVSMVINDFIYSIQIFPGDKKSFNEIKDLLTEIMKSLQYTYNTYEPYDLCPQAVLDF